MFSIIGAILAIGFLIIVHEAGHYFVARWCKMRVDRFSIGFGPPILSWKRGETAFTIGPIPFGGFVQINGMTMIDEIDPDDPRQYPNRPVWQRFAAIFAGPGTNYLAAIVLAFFLYSIAGLSTGTNWFVIDGFAKDVDTVGELQPGDQILKVGDEPLFASYEHDASKGLSEFVQESRGQEMVFTVLRDGEQLVVRATPRLVGSRTCAPVSGLPEYWCIWAQDAPTYQLGVALSLKPEARADVGVVAAAGHALVYPVRQTEIIGKGLYDIVTGREKGELAGPVGIATIAKKQFDEGWIAVMQFLMVLNVYLGLFNLLPLPALDGGRLVFLSYEMATRRRANPKIEATVHMVGIMALLLVMVLVTYKDIARLF